MTHKLLDGRTEPESDTDRRDEHHHTFRSPSVIRLRACVGSERRALCSDGIAIPRLKDRVVNHRPEPERTRPAPCVPAR
jgi:hypothetical protein